MFRLARPFNRMARPWRLNLAARVPRGQIIRVERVKVKQARPVTRFLGTTFKVGAVGFLVLVVISAAIPDDDNDDEHLEGEIFIPFPGTTRKLPGQPYPSNSPEIREFERIAQSPKLRESMKRETVQLAWKTIAMNPALVLRIGKPNRVGRVWLDISFPQIAPPEYERSGILITDEIIEWATVACDSATIQRLQRYLWPQEVTLGALTVGTAVLKQAVAEWGRYFGFSSEGSRDVQNRPNPGPPVSPPSSSIGSPLQREIERLREAARGSQDISDSNSATSSTERPTANTPSAPVPGKPAVQQRGENTADATPKNMPKPIDEGILAYRRSWRTLKPDPPRGSVLVWGRIEFEAPRGKVIVAIASWYNPKTGSIDVPSSRMQISDLVIKKEVRSS
ncbi:hypothetical protein VTK26DRAFT_2596 [Humicola hyalothermophila]